MWSEPSMWFTLKQSQPQSPLVVRVNITSSSFSLPSSCITWYDPIPNRYTHPNSSISLFTIAPATLKRTSIRFTRELPTRHHMSRGYKHIVITPSPLAALKLMKMQVTTEPSRKTTLLSSSVQYRSMSRTSPRAKNRLFAKNIAHRVIERAMNTIARVAFSSPANKSKVGEMIDSRTEPCTRTARRSGWLRRGIRNYSARSGIICLQLQMFKLLQKNKDRLVVFILGTTAVGKTKLSLQLARLLDGEIVGGDSMQLYKYADIMTAKATPEEQARAPHHMLDVLQLNETAFNRNKYFQNASAAIDAVFARGRVPIVVGGTNYFIETLLFNQQPPQTEALLEPQGIEQLQEGLTDKMTAEQKYKLLERLDPKAAAKLHPNDHQRVGNYLKVLQQNRYLPSSKFIDLGNQKLRYQNSLIIWVRCNDLQRLKQMMRTRITQMLTAQGLAQIIVLLNICTWHNGVQQSIGYKQFTPFLALDSVKAIVAGLNLAEPIPILKKRVSQTIAQTSLLENQQFKQTLQKCKQNLVEGTFQYAKRQLKWIRRRIIANQNHTQILPRVVLLQFNCYTQFHALLDGFKSSILQDRQNKFVKFKFPEKEFEKLLLGNQPKGPGVWQKRKCEDCDREFRGQNEWNDHIRSLKHRKRVQGKERHQLNLKRKIQKQRDKI